ncbi:hypothetical protein C2I18_06210 [Paenibacillus sp. PK3_47]|nr:hypothetical protein C2I18_06210 [Paenibacillus sp. PK3_47]
MGSGTKWAFTLRLWMIPLAPAPIRTAFLLTSFQGKKCRYTVRRCSAALIRSGCGAVSPSSYVIDPLGDLYKCWNEIGRKDCSVGTVSGGVKYNSVLVNYMEYDPFKVTKCSDCAVLPACLGGCPYVAALKKDPRCDSIRYNAKHMIWLIHEVKAAEPSPVATQPGQNVEKGHNKQYKRQ